MNRYEELASKIEERIRNGLILTGQKLPSVRDYSLKEDVSPSTVVEAYELLRSRGLVESRHRSGFYVSAVPIARLDASKKSAAFIPNSRMNPDELIRALRLATHDPKIFPFGAASPLPDFFPTKALNRTIQKVLSDEPAMLTEYRFPPGSEALRDQIVSRYTKLGVKLNLESVVTTAGAIEAIGLALKAVARSGDVVAVETPCYFGILQLVRSLGYKILEIPLHPEFGLLPTSFEDALKKCKTLKALVTVSSFSNPLGSLVPEENKAQLVAMAEKFGVVIIEDDIYGDLFFEGKRPKIYKSFDKNETVITCGSFAKTLSPSFRVGYVCSKKYAFEIAFHKAASSSGVSALAEEALAVFLDMELYDKHLRFLRQSYKTLLAQYSQVILAHFPEGTKISRPQGGFVLWVQLPKGIDSRDVQRLALEQSISIAPGPIFSASNKDFVNFIRINGAIPWSGHSQRAIVKLGKILESLSR